MKQWRDLSNHSATSVSPSELSFNRKIRTKLLQSQARNSVKDRDADREDTGKRYSNVRWHAAESDMKVSDEILMMMAAS